MAWVKRFNGDMENIERQAQRYALHAEQARQEGNTLLVGFAVAVFGFLAVMAVIVVGMGM